MLDSIARGFGLACVVAAAAAASDAWVEYVDETAVRLVADPAVGLADPDEKDYAWGDVDGDGDTDLVVARKQPFATLGRRTNVLFLNEDGVLVDRTAEHAAASDVPGDQGFLTPTNDRDVVLVDLDNDGDLDIVTATTLSDGLSKAVGHPRIYVNRGVAEGAWLGFRHEDARIPQLLTAGGLPANPRFNAVAAGDVTGDGAPELYFVDSDQLQPPELDLDDRLLVNDGAGFFIDASTALMTPEMLESSFGTAAAVVDVNGDARNDIVKSTHLNFPIRVTAAYDTDGVGGFDTLDPIYTLSPTSMSVGDLNGDERPDLVITDDGTDRYLLNGGNGADGLADFSQHTLPPSSFSFGGNSAIADLDGDGFRDVLIADMDIELPGCQRQVNIFRNLGNAPTVSFADDPPGGLEPVDRQGTFDVAVFDLNGDGKLDLVLGRCDGMRIWIRDSTLGDVNGDGVVDVLDLVAVILAWGPCPAPPLPCPADTNADGTIDVLDLVNVILTWGAGA